MTEKIPFKTKGIIKKIKADKKGFMLDDDKWYSNKFMDNLPFFVGDEVAVEGTINGDFLNYSKVDLVMQAPPMFSPKQGGVNNEAMYVSYAKDLFICMFNKYSDPQTENILSEAVRIVKEMRDKLK